MPLLKSKKAFPGITVVPPKPKAGLKAPKMKVVQVPIAFPKAKGARQLPISRTKTFVMFPIERFAGTTKRTI